MLIGFEEYLENGSGWIMSQVNNNRIDLEIDSIYVASVYWVITSFSSIGYGDIVGTSDREMGYQMLIEMMGIGVFGYMIGTIQTLFIGFGPKDQNAEQMELVELWLIQLDKAKPQTLLSKKVFQDVRDFYRKKLNYETNIIMQNVWV